MTNDKWKMENDKLKGEAFEEIYHFPFSIFHLSFVIMS